MQFIHKYGSPKYFYQWSKGWQRWLTVITLLLLSFGLYQGFFVAPTDYQQGESYRIIFIHVPAAWMSMFVYMAMAVSSIVALVWRIKVAEIVIGECAIIGASFTALALITGMLWGKPMWGTYWVWDARLTSELVLLFLYFGVIALHGAFEDPRTGARAAAILAIVGIINIPIIKYSVEWWSTLHQPATVAKFDKPSMHMSMLIPLLVMAVAFKTYFLALLFSRTRSEVLSREKNTSWVKDVMEKES
ncbi:MAG: heme ABC transporter permease [Gammaproteobacteria bacterium]|nr:heme ABC transporter permease [Gammaproteobacteria bacterium]